MKVFIRFATVIIGAMSLMMSLSSCQGARDQVEDATAVSASSVESLEGVSHLTEVELEDLAVSYDETTPREVSLRELSTRILSLLSDRLDLGEGESALYRFSDDPSAGRLWVDSVQICNPKAVGEAYPAALGLFVGFSLKEDGYARFLDRKILEWEEGKEMSLDGAKLRITLSTEEDEQYLETGLPTTPSDWEYLAEEQSRRLSDLMGHSSEIHHVSCSIAPTL